MPGEWKEVRRGPPANEVRPIPSDGTTVWASWDRGRQNVTVYRTDLSKTSMKAPGQPRQGEQYWVVAFDGSSISDWAGPLRHRGRAMDKAEQMKTNAFIGI